MDACVFCRIARRSIEAVVLWEDDELLVFLDRCPIREGHSQIITKQHYETFEETPAELASRIIQVGQRLARKMKSVYGVGRVAFLITGSDVAHVHAHVIPMHENTDITSARYITGGDAVLFSSDHLVAEKGALESVRNKIQHF